MPITRASKNDPISTVAEFLSFLQVEGHLDDIDIPDWATGGTSVEELMVALQHIGDGEWLADHEGSGVLESADGWIRDFLLGRAVPLPADVAGRLAEEQDVVQLDILGVDEQILSALSDYVTMLPANSRKALASRLEDPNDLREIGPEHMEGLVMSIMACGFFDDDQFKNLAPSFLTKDNAKDADLAAMSIFYLENRAETFNALGLHGAGLARAEKRAKAMLTKLKKLIKE